LRKLPRNARLKKPVSDTNKRDAVTSLPTGALPPKLDEALEVLRPWLDKNGDVIQRLFKVKGNPPIPAAALYIEGVIDSTEFNRDVLYPLMMHGLGADNENQSDYLINTILQTAVATGQITKAYHTDDVLHALFDGFVILLFDHMAEALVIDIRGGEMRSVQEPIVDKSISGPREGFVENLVVNVALIRRKIRDPNLVVYRTTVGQRSRTDVAVLYIEDVADPAIVAEMKKRIDEINIDVDLSAGYINQLIEDNPYTVFPLSRVVERTDIAAADLAEGRVVVISDQSPLVLIYPALFIEMFQTAEDYYEKAMVGSFWRPFRLLAFFLAVSLPSLYIALLSFQPELIPLDLLISMARARAMVPYPVVFETIIQLTIIQFIIEAGLRLPNPLGQTIGVVSGIILGQAAITAKLASPEVIIIIAIATIATFCIPNYGMAMAARIINIPLLILSATFGLFGFSLGWLLIIAHLSGLTSAGVPYFAPFAPFRFSDLHDSIIRIFLWKFKNRPASIPHQDQKRQGDGQRGGAQ